jgi:broad specificity phosphatase PhoE
MDSDLSPEGELMVNRLAEVLSQQDFLARNGVQLIVHSPLLRARKTCAGLFSSHNPNAVPVMQHEALYEKDVSETVGLGDMTARVAQVTAWLLQREEQCVCVVGHSAFFRAMLAPAAVRLDNCDVFQVQLGRDGSYADAVRVVQGGRSLLPVGHV